MSGLLVRYDSDSGSLLIGEPGAIVQVKDDGTGTFFAHLDDVRAAGATDLRRTLERTAADWGEERGLAVSDIEYSLFDDEYSAATAISFSGSADGLRIDIGFLLDDFDDEAATEADIRHTVGPLLERQGWTFIRAEMDPNYAASPWLWHLRVEPKTRGRTVGELYAVAEEILALVEATTGDGLRRETVLELLRAARAELLVGQPEGDWLDVKSQDYDLSTESGKISLAQDVARFANAEYGGIVVVGMGSKKTGDAEIIKDVRPVPPDARGVRRHRQAINNRVFPPPDGLTVEEVMVGSGRLMVLHVPPQPEELKPFLVHGAIVDGRVEGAFISIVRRRGEASIPVTAAAIHASRGRARLAPTRRAAWRGTYRPLAIDCERTFGETHVEAVEEEEGNQAQARSRAGASCAVAPMGDLATWCMVRTRVSVSGPRWRVGRGPPDSGRTGFRGADTRGMGGPFSRRAGVIAPSGEVQVAASWPLPGRRNRGPSGEGVAGAP